MIINPGIIKSCEKPVTSGRENYAGFRWLKLPVRKFNVLSISNLCAINFSVAKTEERDATMKLDTS